MCLCERDWREGMCVCVRERGRERERECVFERGMEREGEGERESSLYPCFYRDLLSNS